MEATEPGCAKGANIELALPADVEEPGPEGEGHGEAGKQQGDGFDQCAGQIGPRAKGAVGERMENSEGTAPGEERDGEAHPQGDEEGVKGIEKGFHFEFNT